MMHIKAVTFPFNSTSSRIYQNYNFMINSLDSQPLNQVSYHQSDMIRVISVLKKISSIKLTHKDYSNYPVNVFINELSDQKVDAIIFDSSNYQIVDNFQSIFYTCYLIKKTLPNCIIVLSGRDPSYFSKQIILAVNDVDLIVYGEIENTISELFKKLPFFKKNWRQSITSIRGLVYKDEKLNLIKTPERELIQDLDELPYPDYGSLNVYKNTLAMISSARGCPFSCNFCYKTSRFVRTHSPAYVVKLMEKLKSDYGIEHFTLDDEITGTNIKWLEEFADQLKASHLKIRYNCYGRADMLNLSRLDILKSSGCYELRIGVESGSKKILAAMNKKTNREIIINAFNELKNKNINTLAFILLGYPPEDHETIKETIDLLSIIKPTYVSAKVVKILPGTKLYWDMIKENKMDDTMYFFNPYMLHPRGGLSLETLQQYADQINGMFNGYA
ncbi:MAG: radical SAM protein [Parachlamydiaceae bacterium]|nr:radical SAM protein [Parachlamydiaceae bacterium]